MTGPDARIETIRRGLRGTFYSADAALAADDAALAALESLAADLARAKEEKATLLESAAILAEAQAKGAKMLYERLEAAEARHAQTVEALEPFAKLSDEIDDMHEGAAFTIVARFGDVAGRRPKSSVLQLSDLRAARAALAADTDSQQAAT